MNRKRWKKRHIGLWICIATFLLSTAICGICHGIYQYHEQREYGTLRHIKLLHVYPWEHDRFEIDLPVEFVSERYHAGIVQKLLVNAENGKCFMIFRFEDDHIQLMRFPIKKYFGIARGNAYYNITDPAAEERIQKLLEAYRQTDDHDAAKPKF